ncbi:hypothetical protein D6777_03895 [Candidatus Woesearchaeota archaeon]|nr:MAG: hypothetical protein D6777_03895 [Candidatus Woesearchaeota archaeon]
MDYSDWFLSTESPVKLSPLESLVLNEKLLLKLAEEGFSPEYAPKLTSPYYPSEKILAWLDTVSQTPGYKLFKSVYRPRLHNLDKIPDTGALLVSNHSSMFMADIAPIVLGLYEKSRRVVYSFVHKILKDSDFVKSVGGVVADKTLATEILAQNNLALVCPEGIEGACRSKLYAYNVMQVGGFSFNGMGYLKSAYRSKKPVIPIAIIGGEENCLVLGNIKPEVEWFFNKLQSRFNIKNYDLGRKSFGWIAGSKVIPFLVAPPLPVSIDAYVGDPIFVQDYVNENEHKFDYYRANLKVMGSLQDLIDKNLGNRLGLYKKLRKVSTFVDLMK